MHSYSNIRKRIHTQKYTHTYIFSLYTETTTNISTYTYALNFIHPYLNSYIHTYKQKIHIHVYSYTWRQSYIYIPYAHTHLYVYAHICTKIYIRRYVCVYIHRNIVQVAIKLIKDECGTEKRVGV